MSYAVSPALQTAVFQQLAADSALGALVGSNIYDAVPAGALPPLYVALGAERVKDASDVLQGGSLHDFVVSVISERSGFHNAKAAAAAVADTLIDAQMVLARGRLVGLRFVKAEAKRDRGGRRRIDLTFRARVEDDGPA